MKRNVKKILTLVMMIFSVFSLASCFEVTYYSNMIEYSEEEVLLKAQEKYNISEWLFTGIELRGATSYDENGNFKVIYYGDQFSPEFINGDNIEVAMTSFAGKNGNHDIQGMYSSFLAYVALGKTDDSLKFIYYNTNLNKNVQIIDTIGSSDYIYEVLPTEINDSLFDFPSNWEEMVIYSNKKLKGMKPIGLHYSGERLMRVYHNDRDVVEIEFYRENDQIVYDIFWLPDEENRDTRRIVFSTSEKYGVIYNYYGLDKSKYFNVKYTVEQSSEDASCMLLKGYVEPKEFEGTVLYSEIVYYMEFLVNRDGKNIIHGNNETIIDVMSFNRGFLIDKIEGVDHKQTSSFIIQDFYIFYEKE